MSLVFQMMCLQVQVLTRFLSWQTCIGEQSHLAKVGRSRFQVTQVLYLPEHHLKYKRHGLIQDNCFLSDDDEVLALPLSANLDEEVQEDETDIFKKLIAKVEKSSFKKVKSPPAKKVKSPPAKKVKEHVGCSHIDVDVGVSDSVPANGIKPDVVIEVEEG